jgi:hypothetical protein
MSCNHSSYCSVIDLVPCSSLTVEAGDYASRETAFEADKSLQQSLARTNCRSIQIKRIPA